MTRTYDPDLDYLHVQRNGTILLEGDPIGHVEKIEGGFGIPASWKWRAEVGNPRDPETWPRFRASYGRTRMDAVGDAIEGLEIPA